ncbi:MAG: glycosyltransferase family 2 protein [Sulfitobacter sp.]
MTLAAVVIGRNEGARLVACLEALQGQVAQIVYVDSGSTDGSVAAAEQRGAQVIALDMSQPFTAARARNAGLAALNPDIVYVQLLDGDCVLRKNWLETAQAFLDQSPKAAIACGRRRERHPQVSPYNALIDAEWETPVGRAKACGGDALMRVSAVQGVQGYRETLIAGEEPELCVRLRQDGWEIWRLDAEMTWHDAAITRFAQWWQRSKRAGHAFAEGASLHGAPPERHWVAETRRALLWGFGLPCAIVIAAMLISGWAFLLIFIYPAQVVRLARGHGMRWAFFTTLGKLPEAIGALQFYKNRLTRQRGKLIEYK